MKIDLNNPVLKVFDKMELTERERLGLKVYWPGMFTATDLAMLFGLPPRIFNAMTREQYIELMGALYDDAEGRQAAKAQGEVGTGVSE